VCGGCSLPNVPYADQLARKRARLADLLRVDVPPLVPSPLEAGFRSKVAFVFATAPPDTLVMGHYAAGSTAAQRFSNVSHDTTKVARDASKMTHDVRAAFGNRVLPVQECPVHAARGNRIAFALHERLARAGIRAADTRGGILRHVIVRTNADESEAVATLVVTRNDKALRSPVRGLLDSQDRPDGFFLNIHDQRSRFMIGDETLRIDGRSHVRETGIGGHGAAAPLKFLVSPTTFFQTNVGAARALVNEVVASVGAAARILDLYCGSGLFTLPLAAAGATVTAVEDNRQAIADLQANVKANRLAGRRVRPICGRVEDVLARISRDAADAVVLDPPRDGCAPAVLRTVFERISPPCVVYVSCNPEVLASELPLIRHAGYEVARVQGVDMFPHTEHIEAVVTFRRSTERPPRTRRRSSERNK
jgi:23S rRNA (uracil1939-C5)-methyltransferase